MNLSDPMLIIGCGNMGRAILDGILSNGGQASNLTIVDPDQSIRDELGSRSIETLPSIELLSPDYQPSIVLIAITPQQISETLPKLKIFSGQDILFFTIAAGIKIETYEHILGNESAIVRAMPNTPCSVNKGMTVLLANSSTSDQQKRTCMALMKVVGNIAWINDESYLDAITALSGGGPAYVFLLIECLAAAGIKAGLPHELSMMLARETVIGAGELAYCSNESAERLRLNVTSPGGTTQAALDILMNDDVLENLFITAVMAARDKSLYLGEN